MKPFNENEIEGKQAPSNKKFDAICNILLGLAVVYIITHLAILIAK